MAHTPLRLFAYPTAARAGIRPGIFAHDAGAADSLSDRGRPLKNCFPSSREDDGTYEPMPEHIYDGGALLEDPTEFFEMTNSFAAVMCEGQLFVYDRNTFEMRNLSSLRQAKPAKPERKLSSIKGD